MSRPENILSSYRTYSYYHVIAMCDTSETADSLAKVSNVDVWLHPSVDLDPQLGKYTPKQLPLTDSRGQLTGTTGRYVVLINGATDADFSISKLQWSSFTAASATFMDRNTSIALEGTMEISEPRGVALLDQIVRSCLSMGISAEAVVYVIKTFIIGTQTIDGQDRLDYQTDIEPLQVLINDITASFTPMGGLYHASFFSVANGASRLPQFSKVADGVHVELNDLKDTSLQTGLNNLFVKLNEMYATHYSCVTSVAEQLSKEDQDILDAPINKSVVDALRPISYTIKLDSTYQDPSYVITDQPAQYKTTGACSDGVTLRTMPGSSIEDMIHNIMLMCPKIREDAGQTSTASGLQYEYKINTAVYSYTAQNRQQYEVRFEIVRSMVPKGAPLQALLGLDPETQDDPTGLANALKENVIEFDYIYSGLNIDILEFDIKANMGQAYLQIATMTNTLKDRTEGTASKSTRVLNLENQTNRFGQVGAIPVPFGSQAQMPWMVNSQNPGSTAAGEYTLNRHASLEVLEASVTIVGNHRLMSSVNRTSSGAPTRLAVAAHDAAKSDGQATQTQSDFRHWGYIPAFVKINIFMPQTNDDMMFFETATNQSKYTKKFWYDQYYYVVGIVSNFEEGTFTQTLSLLAAQDNSTTKLLATEKQDSSAAHKAIADCFSSKLPGSIDTPPTTKEAVPPAKPFERVPTEQQSSGKVDFRSNTGGPSDVKGWEKDWIKKGTRTIKQVSPPIKQAIVDAAAQYGVSARTLAMFASQESTFNPLAKAPTSTATGLFQHLNSTWMGLVREGKIRGIASNTDAVTALALRRDPVYSSYGGAAFLADNIRIIKSDTPGDTYLAHFAGPGTAKKIIAAGPSATLDSAIGQKGADNIRRANPGPTGKGAFDTCATTRQWAERVMRETLIENPPAEQVQQAVEPVINQVIDTPANTQSARTAGANVKAVEKPLTNTEQQKRSNSPCGDKKDQTTTSADDQSPPGYVAGA